MGNLEDEKMEKVQSFIEERQWDTLIWKVSEIKTEIGNLKTEISDITWIETNENGKIWNIIDTLSSNKTLLEYAKLALKDEKSLTFTDRINMLRYEASSTLKWCTYFTDFKKFLKNLKEWGDVSRNTETQTEVTPASTYYDDSESKNEQMKREENKWNPKRSIERDIIDKWRDKWEQIPEERVKEVWNYIDNGWTFYSPTKWRVKWWKNKYKHVCSTWSYNVLWRLWFPKVSNSLGVDLDWKILPRMWLKYIWTVDPDDLEKNWYKPQDGDTAVRPKFTRDSWKKTQHQATYINGHWVSDTVQKRMSCYWDKNEPRNVRIYRYTWETPLV